MEAGAERLIRGFTMRMEEPGCSPGASFWRTVIHLEDDISEVLPYINAELEGADYNHQAKTLLWNSDEGYKYAFRPREIAIAPISERETGERLGNEIIDWVSDVWNRRREIEPSFEAKPRPPGIIEILKFLPRTNCKECGFPTCMAFAVSLIQEQARVSECPHISEEAVSQISAAWSH